MEGGAGLANEKLRRIYGTYTTATFSQSNAMVSYRQNIVMGEIKELQRNRVEPSTLSHSLFIPLKTAG